MHAQVINATRYSFTDETSKRVVSGCKLSYIAEQRKTDKFNGSEIVTVTGVEDIFFGLPTLPAKLDIETTITLKGGKPVAVLLAVKGV